MSSSNTSIPEINHDDFPAHKDSLNPIDHISKFLGLAVAQLYLFCAFITAYEVVSRYLFIADITNR